MARTRSVASLTRHAALPTAVGEVEFHRNVRRLMLADSDVVSPALNADLDTLCHAVNALFGAARTSVWLHERRHRKLRRAASSDLKLERHVAGAGEPATAPWHHPLASGAREHLQLDHGSDCRLRPAASAGPREQRLRRTSRSGAGRARRPPIRRLLGRGPVPVAGADGSRWRKLPGIRGTVRSIGRCARWLVFRHRRAPDESGGSGGWIGGGGARYLGPGAARSRARRQDRSRPPGVRRSRISTKRRVSLNAIVRRAVAARRDACRSADITLSVTLAAPAPRVIGDPRLLQQALLNILTNAEHAVTGGARRRVSVSTHVAPSRSMVAVSVRDNGAGIPDAALSHLFEPFYTTRDVGNGTGLRLAITCGVVRDHDGSRLRTIGTAVPSSPSVSRGSAAA